MLNSKFIDIQKGVKNMTNTALQAMIDEFGDHICIIVFDNDNKIFIGYKSSPIKSVSDLKLETKGGIDFIGVPFIPNDPKLVRLGVTGTVWHPTDCIQAVMTMDEGYEDYRLDPFSFM